MSEKRSIKITLTTFIWILVFTIIIAILVTCLTMTKLIKGNLEKEANANNTENVVETIQEDKKEVKEKEIIADSSEFDWLFLKLENEEINKIYSPLSLKYALNMLKDAANGETKEQISNLLGNGKLTKYISNQNFSLANSFFIKESYKGSVKSKFIESLKDNYDAEIKFDTFETADNINAWVKDKTLDIIPNMVQDEDVKELDFALINALAIDMEWKEKFICLSNDRGYEIAYFDHEQRDFEMVDDWKENYKKMIHVNGVEDVSKNEFYNPENELEISGMEIYATINNYDIISDLGEEYIKNTVSEEYRKFAKDEEYDTKHAGGDFLLSEDTTDEGIQAALDEFLPGYIKSIGENYHKIGATTDFSIYIDDETKVFAKDLKEYDDTTLQYIGIMPTQENLNKFVENINVEKINNYIVNLKNVEDYKNFKEGVVTRIYGFIPKFDFEYNLSLLEDLKKLGITNVFDYEKSDLSNMIEGDAFVSSALHKANIEFTQDGIKAAAATMMGGLGAGSPFDYFFDVPCEEIDMTFDKPYMFLIRDKETGEIWFTGTVYEPLLWENEPQNKYDY